VTADVENRPGGAMHPTVGIFTTRVVQRQADGQQLVFYSRQHRKALPPVQVGADGAEIQAALEINPWLQLWAPQRLAWWIALSFIIGSACFGLGVQRATRFCPAFAGMTRMWDMIFVSLK
jgi:hypothetical protein